MKDAIHKGVGALSQVLRADGMGNRVMPGAHVISLLVVAVCFGFGWAQNIVKSDVNTEVVTQPGVQIQVEEKG